MRSTHGLLLAGFVAGLLSLSACASGGSSLMSSTYMTSEDLAAAQQDNLYDFFRAHGKVSIVAAAGGQEVLQVYGRRAGGIGGGARSNRSLNPDSEGVTLGDEGGQPAGSGVTAASGASGGSGGALLIVNEDEVPEPIEFLRQLPLSMVEKIQVLRPSEAGARYGGDGRVGAVVVTTAGG